MDPGPRAAPGALESRADRRPVRGRAAAPDQSRDDLPAYWADKRAGGTLHTYLRGARKQCRKRYGQYDSRGRLAGKRPITARPAIVEARSRIGDWEADTILGPEGHRHCVLSLVERKTGYLVLGKLPARTVAAVNRRAIPLLRQHPHPVHTLTCDNGTEFHGYATLEAATTARERPAIAATVALQS